MIECRFRQDFGGGEFEMLLWIAEFLDDTHKGELLRLAKDMNTLVILYHEFDWGPNSWTTRHPQAVEQ